MGGDDLGDDDYLLSGEVPRPATSDEDESTQQTSGKRRGSEQVSPSSAAPEPKRHKNLILEASREIELQSVDDQATFLSSVLRHYTLLQDSTADADNLDVEPSHMKQTTGSSWVEKLHSLSSTKQMRSWKQLNSPKIIIVTISARRAVQILKDMSELKVRVGKLFPKNNSIEKQLQELSERPYGVVIGTPHRLRALLEKSMSLAQTHHVVFDSARSQKDYSVCTLPDTAPHCMDLLRECVLPELRKRKTIKLSFC